jgi:hypothetical protein
VLALAQQALTPRGLRAVKPKRASLRTTVTVNT